MPLMHTTISQKRKQFASTLFVLSFLVSVLIFRIYIRYCISCMYLNISELIKYFVLI